MNALIRCGVRSKTMFKDRIKDSYKVFFTDKSVRTYVCGLKSVGIYTDKGATNDNSSSK